MAKRPQLVSVPQGPRFSVFEELLGELKDLFVAFLDPVSRILFAMTSKSNLDRYRIKLSKHSFEKLGKYLIPSNFNHAAGYKVALEVFDFFASRLKWEKIQYERSVCSLKYRPGLPVMGCLTHMLNSIPKKAYADLNGYDLERRFAIPILLKLSDASRVDVASLFTFARNNIAKGMHTGLNGASIAGQVINSGGKSVKPFEFRECYLRVLGFVCDEGDLAALDFCLDSPDLAPFFHENINNRAFVKLIFENLFNSRKSRAVKITEYLIQKFRIPPDDLFDGFEKLQVANFSSFLFVWNQLNLTPKEEYQMKVKKRFGSEFISQLAKTKIKSEEHCAFLKSLALEFRSNSLDAFWFHLINNPCENVYFQSLLDLCPQSDIPYALDLDALVKVPDGHRAALGGKWLIDRKRLNFSDKQSYSILFRLTSSKIPIEGLKLITHWSKASEKAELNKVNLFWLVDTFWGRSELVHAISTLLSNGVQISSSVYDLSLAAFVKARKKLKDDDEKAKSKTEKYLMEFVEAVRTRSVKAPFNFIELNLVNLTDNLIEFYRL